MKPLASTPLSSLASDNDSASSAQLYGFLGDVLRDIRAVTPKAQMDSYATLLNSLVENFLMKLSEPSKATWSSQSEAIKLTDRSIDIIQQVILKVEEFIESNSNLVQTVLKGLFHLICTLNIWVLEAFVIQQHNDAITDATTLKKKATHCAISIIKHISNPIRIALACRSCDDLHVQTILTELINATKGMRRKQ
jgi:hypothetical protein